MTDAFPQMLGGHSPPSRNAYESQVKTVHGSVYCKVILVLLLEWATKMSFIERPSTNIVPSYNPTNRSDGLVPEIQMRAKQRNISSVAVH
jgi:hypothetical protein